MRPRVYTQALALVLLGVPHSSPAIPVLLDQVALAELRPSEPAILLMRHEDCATETCAAFSQFWSIASDALPTLAMWVANCKREYDSEGGWDACDAVRAMPHATGFDMPHVELSIEVWAEDGVAEWRHYSGVRELQALADFMMSLGGGGARGRGPLPVVQAAAAAAPEWRRDGRERMRCVKWTFEHLHSDRSSDSSAGDAGSRLRVGVDAAGAAYDDDVDDAPYEDDDAGEEGMGWEDDEPGSKDQAGEPHAWPHAHAEDEDGNEDGNAGESSIQREPLRPEDVKPTALYTDLTNRSVALPGGTLLAVAEGHVSWPPPMDRTSRFDVLPAVVSADEVRSILRLINRTAAEGGLALDADPDSVDGMASRERRRAPRTSALASPPLTPHLLPRQNRARHRAPCTYAPYPHIRPPPLRYPQRCPAPYPHPVTLL